VPVVRFHPDIIELYALATGTFRSYGARAFGSVHFYKHFIPTGLAPDSSRDHVYHASRITGTHHGSRSSLDLTFSNPEENHRRHDQNVKQR
jgi:hypothetical protein